jgi:hypothetical protein
MTRTPWLYVCAAAVFFTQTSTTQRSRDTPDPYAIATLCIPQPPAATRTPVTVTNGDELQSALDRASAGDTIVLAAGATFRPVSPDRSFILRNRPMAAGQWITIRSSSATFDPSGAVPPNTRVDPSHTDQMPYLRAIASNAAAVRTESGAHGYWLIGLDIGIDASLSQQTTLVELGAANNAAAASQPADIVIDRCYVHGNNTGNYRRGVALNGTRLAVIDSYVANFHDANSDSQAIAGWNGTGPFKIVNNYLEAASENIMFGGGDPAVADLVPSDIEIRRNLCTKPLAWRTSGIAVKNAFELKNARRVLVEGNTFENVWPSGQDGTGIVLKSANQDGKCTWCVTEYVTFRNNVVRAASHGLLINAAEAGARGLPLPLHVNHIRIQNVLFDGIGLQPWGGGKLFRVFGGVSDVEITHVTSTSNPMGILDSRDVSDLNPNLIFTHNIIERRFYGIGAGSNEGIPTLTRNFSPFTYNQNVLVNMSGATDQSISDSALKSRYPPVTSIAHDWAAVNLDAGTQRLAPTSPFYRVGDDGKDLGIDVDALMAAQAGPSKACEGMAIPRR